MMSAPCSALTVLLPEPMPPSAHRQSVAAEPYVVTWTWSM